MDNSDAQMKRPFPPLSFVNEFRPHIELVPATEDGEWIYLNPDEEKKMRFVPVDDNQITEKARL
ncbi:hypothetical protein [Yersinia rohdei]|uniref:hypothetical protein n=1 Tax=Yersinia rohdei TaxID=29485 RepID=UPI0025AACE94|nr:hypothetical protein [Yersinia rohdei]MDN0096573.1 hypothetical protein [Yersinia rohdei]